jgi:hypothetical protein
MAIATIDVTELANNYLRTKYHEYVCELLRQRTKDLNDHFFIQNDNQL